MKGFTGRLWGEDVKSRKLLMHTSVFLAFIAGTAFIAYSLYQKPYDDLPSYYWGAHFVFVDHVSPYQQQHYQAVGSLIERKLYPYLYPPPSLLLFSPMILCSSYESCKAIFSVLNLVLWWYMAWLACQLACRYAPQFTERILMGVPLWMLAFIPIMDVLRTGQVDLLVMACLSPLFFYRERSWLSAVAPAWLLTAAIMLKVYLLLALPVLLLFRMWRLLVLTLSVCGVLVVLSLLLMSPGLWLDWLYLGMSSGGYGKQIPYVLTVPWNQSFNGIFVRQYLGQHVMPASSMVWIVYTASLVVVALVFLTAWRMRKMASGLSIALAMILLAIILVAPLTWLHHFVFCIPAIVTCMMLLFMESSGLSKWILSGLMYTCVLVITCPLVMNMLFPGFARDGVSGVPMTTGLNLFLSSQAIASFGILLVFVVITTKTGGRDMNQEGLHNS